MEDKNDTWHMLLLRDNQPDRHGEHARLSRTYDHTGKLKFHEGLYYGSIVNIVLNVWGDYYGVRRIRLWAPKNPTEMQQQCKNKTYTTTVYAQLSPRIVDTGENT